MATIALPQLRAAAGLRRLRALAQPLCGLAAAAVLLAVAPSAWSSCSARRPRSDAVRVAAGAQPSPRAARLARDAEPAARPGADQPGRDPPLRTAAGAAWPALSWNRPGGRPAAAAAPARRLPPRRSPASSRPGPAGPLPIIAPDGRTPFEAYRRPVRRQRPAQGRPGHRRPRPQRPRHPPGHRDPAAGDHPVLRALCRGPAGLDRHGPRPRPRGAARDARWSRWTIPTTIPAPTP